MWTAVEKRAMQNLKDELAAAPLISQPLWEEEFIVATDASQFGVGAVLYQEPK
jgi:hypothetical protein